MEFHGASDVILDGNIFGLQTYGGVSGYAARLYIEMSLLGLHPKLTLPADLIYRGFGSTEIAAASDVRREHLPARVTQYLPAAIGRQDAVFHSPYYRRPASRVRRYVVTVHDFTYERFRKGPALWVHHAVKKAAIRAADAVICISEATRRDVLEFCPWIDPARLHVVHHGVGIETFYPDAHDAASGMDRTVLFVGQRGGYKRFDLAVEALTLSPALRLGIVGPPLAVAERELLDRRLANRWTWFGSVGDAALRKLYSSAFAFLFPSDYEGFGLPILEAMACGCPVVTSADEALREIGRDAALFAAEQQPEAYGVLLAMLESSDQRLQMVSRGAAIAAKANWKECARQTIKVLSGE